jgi:site-specific DNA-methyltransferase (adenine-specific)
MLTSHNPDVLSCIANLSSDEVFTPPRIANEVLDLLPPDLWSDANATFLDPACKSGVFLREIAKRLDLGLQEVIPNRQERINHILTRQLFALALTELTALVSRRSVYCSKVANSKYSICDTMQDEHGQIYFRRIEHTWSDGRCAYCSAARGEFDRPSDLESHAYEFIHTERPGRLLNMKFDVIIGNPPYQLNDGGFGRSASPIYQLFVSQAKKLKPRFLTMIIPSRWFAGGKGLDSFRREMLNDNHIRKIVDFEDANECFPGVDIAGGVCYFLMERDSPGPCEITNVQNGRRTTSIRPLNEFSTFVRHSEAVPIIRKVMAQEAHRMNEQVTSRKPFGLPTTTRPMKTGDIILRWQHGEGPFKRSAVSVGVEKIDQWKVITSYVAYDHAGNPGKDGKRKVFSKIDILPPGTICNETYLVVGSYATKKEAEHLTNYMKTKFFRFLLSQFMYSHHLTKDTYSLVPILNMKKNWTDEVLYEKYSLNRAEREFIDSKIRPMDSADE